MANIMDQLQRLVRGEVPPPPVASLIGFQLAALELVERDVTDEERSLVARPPA